MNIEKNTTFGGYGAHLITAGDKRHYMTITDLNIDPNAKYEFRYVSKCRAGFMTIGDFTGTICWLINFEKNALQSAQIKLNGTWLTVIAIKGGRLISCDKALLDIMIPNDFHRLCPNMVSGPMFNFWKNNGITNATPGVFGDIEAQANKPMIIKVIG